jgi:hypothetical protein
MAPAHELEGIKILQLQIWKSAFTIPITILIGGF